LEDFVNEKPNRWGKVFLTDAKPVFFHNPTRFDPLAIIMDNTNIMGKFPRSSRCVELNVA